MGREKYIFKDSSRLYTQANKNAEALFLSLRAEPSFLRETKCECARREIVRISNSTDRAAAEKISRDNLYAAASAVDPRIAIPTLLHAMDCFYYQEKSLQEKHPWLGTALKTAIFVIWKNLHSINSTLKSNTQLIKVVNAAAAWEQLVLHEELAEVFSFGESEIFDAGVSLISLKDNAVLSEWNRFSTKRGLALRTLNSSTSIIWQNPVAFLLAVHEILNGKDARNIELFKGSFFASVGHNNNFWLGIYLRLLVFISACKIQEARNKSSYGLVLFESFPMVLRDLQISPELIQKKIHELYWTKDWYKKTDARRPTNLIVYRPLIRIDEKTFATTILNIGDSINSFIENSIMGNIELDGVNVPESLFNDYISKPFEQHACELFRKVGWQAGGISTSGYWNGGNCNIRHPNNTPIPGEVDVLALSPDKSIAALVECKVLSHPLTRGKLRNIAGKLGCKDDEQFHSKLRKKLEWLKNTIEFKDIPIEGMLLVDEGAYLAQKPEHPVFDSEELAEMLNRSEQYLNAN